MNVEYTYPRGKVRVSVGYTDARGRFVRVRSRTFATAAAADAWVAGGAR